MPAPAATYRFAARASGSADAQEACRAPPLLLLPLGQPRVPAHRGGRRAAGSEEKIATAFPRSVQRAGRTRQERGGAHPSSDDEALDRKSGVEGKRGEV